VNKYLTILILFTYRFYLKRLLQWADEIGLKILLDLHGAPGSQNGFDNSGRRGDVHWYVNERVMCDISLFDKEEFDI